MDEIEIKTPFISLQTDFGFKRAFGSIEHKEALIVFLNALFEGKLVVNDVKFHDKEILPSDEKGKRIVYDVYCTTFIKRTDSPYFPDRQTENGVENMDNTSLAYREGKYAVIFEAAKSNSLREDEKVAYSQSLEKLRDTQLGIQYAAEQAAKQASAKARAEGRAEEKLKIARNMLTKGMKKEDIALLTGLTLSEIENI